MGRRIYDPDEKIIEASYARHQLENLMEVVSLIGTTKKCYFMEMEAFLGNPSLQHDTAGPSLW
eukprot:1835258-Ditylum_brightwellii.AAC.1